MFSVDEYRRGLLAVKDRMKPVDFMMLRVQYYAPGRSVTAHDLAEAIEHPNFRSINGLYGKLGHVLADALGGRPNQRKNGTYEWWMILSQYAKAVPTKSFTWVMHPELAQALSELNILAPIERPLAEEILPSGTYPEGATRQVVVNAYERSAAARQRCIEHYGACCSVCNFDFASMYGEVGTGYIHVHHVQPLASVGRHYEVDPVEDLRPVCPNCHAIIHRRTPPYTIAEMQILLLFKAKGNS